MLTHVHVNYITVTLSLLHGYSIILSHCYFMHLYHHYRTLLLPVLVSSSTLDTLIHWTLYFMYTLVILDTIFSCTRINVTRMLYYIEYYYFIYLYHHYIDTISSYSHITVTWIHLYTCFDYSCLHVPESLFLLHDLLLYEHFCIPVT